MVSRESRPTGGPRTATANAPRRHGGTRSVGSAGSRCVTDGRRRTAVPGLPGAWGRTSSPERPTSNVEHRANDNGERPDATERVPPDGGRQRRRRWQSSSGVSPLNRAVPGRLSHHRRTEDGGRETEDGRRQRRSSSGVSSLFLSVQSRDGSATLGGERPDARRPPRCQSDRPNAVSAVLTETDPARHWR